MRISYVIVAGLTAGALFFAGYQTGVSKDPTVRPVVNDETASPLQVRDSLRRWSIKSRYPLNRMQHEVSPRSMFIPTTNQGSGMTCIQLRLQSFDVGGEPVYCYEDDTTKLVAEYSNVE